MLLSAFSCIPPPHLDAVTALCGGRVAATLHALPHGVERQLFFKRHDCNGVERCQEMQREASHPPR